MNFRILTGLMVLIANHSATYLVPATKLNFRPTRLVR